MGQTKHFAVESDSQKLITPHPEPDWRIGFISFSITFLIVYLPNLAPSIVGGDAGELASAVCRRGIAHPPGYPLFSILSYSFLKTGLLLTSATVQPEAAWFLNLMSAVFMAGAAGLIGSIVSGWTGGQRAAGLFSALGFATSRTVWEYAVTTEVFALHAFLICALIFCVVFLPKKVFWLGLICGLGLAHHHTLAFYALPALFFVRKSIRQSWLMFLLGAGAGGVIPYALWVSMASDNAPYSWGDLSNLSGFWTHFTRSDYGSLSLGNENSEVSVFGGDTTFVSRLFEFLKFAPGAMAGGLGLLLATMGILEWKNCVSRTNWHSTPTTWLVASLAFFILVYHALANFRPGSPIAIAVASRFWIQAWIVLWILAGWGFARYSVWLTSRTRFAEILLFLTAIIAGGIQVGLLHNEIRIKTRPVLSEFAEYVLKQLDTGRQSLLLVRGDIFFSIIYRKACLDEGRDAVILSQSLMTYPWYGPHLRANQSGLLIPNSELLWLTPAGGGGYTMRQFLELNGNFDIYLLNGYYSQDRTLLDYFQIWPSGFLEKLHPYQSPPDYATWRNHDARAVSGWDWKQLSKYPPGSWEYELLNQYWSTRHLSANRILDHANSQRPPDFAEVREAIQIYETLLGDLPGRGEKVIYKNIGIAYMSLIRTDPNAEIKMVNAWKRFIAESDPNDPDPDLPKIRGILNLN